MKNYVQNNSDRYEWLRWFPFTVVVIIFLSLFLWQNIRPVVQSLFEPPFPSEKERITLDMIESASKAVTTNCQSFLSQPLPSNYAHKGNYVVWLTGDVIVQQFDDFCCLSRREVLKHSIATSSFSYDSQFGKLMRRPSYIHEADVLIIVKPFVYDTHEYEYRRTMERYAWHAFLFDLRTKMFIGHKTINPDYDWPATISIQLDTNNVNATTGKGHFVRMSVATLDRWIDNLFADRKYETRFAGRAGYAADG